MGKNEGQRTAKIKIQNWQIYNKVSPKLKSMIKLARP